MLTSTAKNEAQNAGASQARPTRPPLIYRRELWQLGLGLAGVLPVPFSRTLSRSLACVYRHARPSRFEIVVQNLLPILDGNRSAARKLARALFRQFAVKLVDLWRVEAGVSSTGWFTDLQGWEHFQAAHARGRGVLILTPHLGNWELGGPLLVERGLRLLVITQSEPGDGFTEMRQASRARWGIDTLVLGQDAFAGLEIVKHLQQGATVALLLDRPPGGATVEVELFGRPFIASAAAAELAWASGCALIGGHLLRKKDGYHGHFYPEFTYEQRRLGGRDARRQLTQKILNAFESVIRQNLDQWYHFVPIWPETKIPFVP